VARPRIAGYQDRPSGRDGRGDRAQGKWLSGFPQARCPGVRRIPYVSIDVLLTWGTQRFAAVTVRNDPRPYGPSNYTVGKLIRHALNMMTGFSILPLQTASMLGFAMTAGGACALVWVLGRYLLYGSVVPGFAFLACMIAIFSGTQLFALGIIGEYVARIHLRTMDRPSYALETTTEEQTHAAH